MPNRLTPIARQLRRDSTDAEQALWRLLRNRQLEQHKFRRQQPIGPYVVDFVCKDQRLVVEVDGGQHQSQSQADDDRSQYLKSQGYRVMRFWNHEVLSDIESVAEAILTELQTSEGPSPQPL